ncbi:4'-phosphopantetheinyl transferase family protein [Streptomyces europaeiscabiei]|uniref:4'-phosphopantetheinyl transferase superfamily protein n=1 Tax=Streptomyces europaeiscabiei TaxID=146819 RepID=A0ABU4NX43_9ACTN|nr:4'-phosphopantetheinyl transferase superfamily protein [Streptomyces europaeiscabiei]MDX2531350.1 4'-phosphopantetheinyl transferase superfamily protein [Streptomyces europaeiscabiei]MDX2759417.1 4'-phosphopantetheinyl transferase superfamily protein [Streptomyces europaeiscabiei]MDX2769040.1 4'-phosphopantetheinyl transferase superfamily protein [Streptomyces europaeiscabiei]MDX3549835.1 4'-phosphopantetheinyl transferase superfamily protein [Streptomyces europaeiscabiei]MDX3559021.1 4'-ph
MTAHAVHIAPPFKASGSRGPWQEVRESIRLTGNATVLTTWGEWLNAALAGGGLREMLGPDWQRYRRTPDPAVRYRFAASRLAVKYTAAAALGTEPVELDLAYTPGGRPYLRGFGQLDMSLTHSEDLIAVGISRTGRIGVDAEPAHTRPPAEGFLGHVCTAAERAELGLLPETEQHRARLRLWTLKEAYSKALGQGLPLGFTEFGFTACERCRAGADAGRCALLCAPDGTPVESDTWTFATYHVLGGRYLVSVACQDTGVVAVPGPTVTAPLDETVLSTLADRLSRQHALSDPLETHVPSSVHLGVRDRGSPRQDR